MFFLLSMVACDGQDYFKDKDLIGLTQEKIIDNLGTPLRSTVLEIYKGSSFLEYQSDLYDLTSKLDIGDTLQIKEMYWKHKEFNRVIWLKNDGSGWKSIDNLSWSKNIKF